MKRVITAIVLLLLFTSCEKKESLDDNILNGTYAKKFNIIHYKTIPMYDVDKNTFEILSFDYARDKNHIYFGNQVIEGVDLETFELVGDYFSKDKNHVYFGENKLEGADPSNFSKVGSGETVKYFTDKKNIYNREGRKLEIDVNTCKIIEDNYAIDNKSVYFNGKKIRGVSRESFEVIGSIYSKDKNHVYIEDRILEEANPTTFEIIWNKNKNKRTFYTKDESYVFYYGEIIKNADPETFEQIGNIYAKDKNHIYVADKILDIKIDKYKVWKNGIYIADDEKVYWGDNIVNEADAKTFEELGEESLAKDNNHVYSGDAVVDDMNPKYLKYIGGPYYLYKDEVHYLGNVSFLGKKRKLKTNIDAKTYAYIADEFIKDKKYVYYAGQILENINPDSVKNLDDVSKIKKKILNGIINVKN